LERRHAVKVRQSVFKAERFGLRAGMRQPAVSARARYIAVASLVADAGLRAFDQVFRKHDGTDGLAPRP